MSAENPNFSISPLFAKTSVTPKFEAQKNVNKSAYKSIILHFLTSAELSATLNFSKVAESFYADFRYPKTPSATILAMRYTELNLVKFKKE